MQSVGELSEVYQGMRLLAAQQCAPVMFGVKPANLLVIDKSYAKVLKSLIVSTGLRARCFDHTTDRQVWYLFDEKALGALLADPAGRSFIRDYGYDETMTMDEILSLTARRFRSYKLGQADFPHELGVLLGYPVGDVKGFIENKGQNFLCCGYWKVYDNEQQARETFKKYDLVKKIALYMVRAGVDFSHTADYMPALA